MTNFSHVPTRQDQIHLRLERWARWVRVTPKPWGRHPMWRNASTSRQWDEHPHIPEAMNTLEAHETERAVSFLPAAHRMAIRWAYVFPHLHEGKVRRALGVRPDTLQRLLVDGRDMLVHRLQKRLAEPDIF